MNRTLETRPWSVSPLARPLTHPSGMSRKGASVDATQSEQWRPTVGYKGYEVSDLGRVRSLDRLISTSVGKGYRRIQGRILSPWTHYFGYKVVRLAADGKYVTWYVHALVLTAFRGSCPDGMVCRHLDGDPANNCLNNLCWGTQSENLLDEVRHGTHYLAKRTHCKYGHEYTPENTQWRSDGINSRLCRQCQTLRVARRRAARVAKRKEAAACGSD